MVCLAALICTSGCSVNLAGESPTTSTPDFITATLPITSTPPAISTTAPPLPLPTSPPIEGITTTQVNVRSEPSTAGSNLGMIAQFSKVQILGRESFAAWYQILYSNSTDGNGWITAAYVQVDDSAGIPVVEIPSGSGSRVTGLALQTINVRSGPGTNFDTLGTLIPNDVVSVTAKDASGAWMQVDFKGQAGWAASEFLKVNDADPLPVSAGPTQASAAEVTAVPTPIAPPPMLDSDSRQSPLASVVLSPSVNRAFQFNGHVSSLNGDAEDWIQFKSSGSRVFAGLYCSTAGIQVELWLDDQPSEMAPLGCGEHLELEIQENGTYFLRVIAGEFETISYHLSLEIAL